MTTTEATNDETAVSFAITKDDLRALKEALRLASEKMKATKLTCGRSSESLTRPMVP